MCHRYEKVENTSDIHHTYAIVERNVRCKYAMVTWHFDSCACADPENFLRGSKFPEGVLRKISTWQKLIIWQFQGGGGGGGAPDPLPAPLDPPMAAYVWRIRSKSYVSTAYLTNDVCSTYERRIGAATHVAKNVAPRRSRSMSYVHICSCMYYV